MKTFSEQFPKVAAIVGLLFLLLTVDGKLAIDFRRHAVNYQDFPQYYMAGQIVRTGAWDSLYPIPTAPETANPGDAKHSDLREGAKEIARKFGVNEEGVRYISPPPFALMMWPLSFLPYSIAHLVWVNLLILSAWGISVIAARLYRICGGQSSLVAGILILLICVSPQAFRWARVANASALMGFLIGWSMLELVRKHDSNRGAIPLAIGAVAKYLTMVFLPVYLVARNWKTIVMSAVIASIFVAVTFVLAGSGPFEVFIKEISPTLGHTTLPERNNALHAFLLRVLGSQSDRPLLLAPWQMVFNLARIGVLVIILISIFTRRRDHWRVPANLLSASLALLAWMTCFGPIFWEHYHAYFAPFWGYLLYEASQSRSRAVFCWIAIALAWLPIQLIPRITVPEPFYSHLLFSALLMMGIGIYATIRPSKPSQA